MNLTSQNIKINNLQGALRVMAALLPGHYWVNETRCSGRGMHVPYLHRLLFVDYSQSESAM